MDSELISYFWDLHHILKNVLVLKLYFWKTIDSEKPTAKAGKHGKGVGRTLKILAKFELFSFSIRVSLPVQFCHSR
jgi:hypothetical protein